MGRKGWVVYPAITDKIAKGEEYFDGRLLLRRDERKKKRKKRKKEDFSEENNTSEVHGIEKMKSRSVSNP